MKFVEDICAAAKGYEYLAEAQLKAEGEGMNGEIYRLNIRFDLADERQRSIAEQTSSLLTESSMVLSTNSLLLLSARLLTAMAAVR